MVNRLKGQHKNYAETGVVPGVGRVGGVQAPGQGRTDGDTDGEVNFGVQAHNHRDGGAFHNDGKHRQPKGMHDRIRGAKPGADGYRSPNRAYHPAGTGVDHGPWETRGAK